MNDIFKANVKAKIEKAMEKEELNQATTAKCIGIAACYVSLIKNPENWDKVPVAAWVIANKWVNSGQGLMEYSKKHGKVLAGTSEPEGPEEHSPESVLGERKPEPIHVRPELMGMAKQEPSITLAYYQEQANKADRRIRELMEENNRLIMQLTQPHLQPLTGSQKLAVDLEVNLVIRVKKVEVEP